MVAFSLKFGIKDWDDAVDAIATQDDRSTAIVLSSLLEDYILQAIRFNFAQSDPKVEGEFFKGYGPLASFRSRIDLGFFLGFYSKECHGRLLKVKDMRNRMAHQIKPHDLETQEVRDLIAFLPDPEELARCWENLPVAMNDAKNTIKLVISELRDYPITGKGKFLAYIQHRMMSMLVFQDDRAKSLKKVFRLHHL